MDIEQLHKKILYPVVRVKTEKAGGSGTVIYSKPDPERSGEFQTFILTNHHVIAGAVSHSKQWDSILKRDRKKEFLQPVMVELFDYVPMSRVDSSNQHSANIVCYDPAFDLAVLKLDSPKEVPNVAKLIDKSKIDTITLFAPLFGCGCSLLHDPFATDGRIAGLTEKVSESDKRFYLTTQNSIFGNSGGAIFLAETGEQIGVTARITGINLGFSQDIMTWMGFSITAQCIYDFLDEQEMKFIYDSTDTFVAALKRREKKQKEMLSQMMGEEDKGVDDEEVDASLVIPCPTSI